MKYYSLEADVFDRSSWRLGDVCGVDNWRLVNPPMLQNNDPLRGVDFYLEVMLDGKHADFSAAGYADIPIVNFKVLKLISGLDGFTALPVLFKNILQKDTYHLIHFWDVADCFDEENSEFEVITADDPVFGDRVGEYRSVTRLVIDASRTEGKHIFRIARLESRLIISEEVKRRFESAGVTGTIFQCVTAD